MNSPPAPPGFEEVMGYRLRWRSHPLDFPERGETWTPRTHADLREFLAGMGVAEMALWLGCGGWVPPDLASVFETVASRIRLQGWKQGDERGQADSIMSHVRRGVRLVKGCRLPSDHGGEAAPAGVWRWDATTPAA